MEDELLTPEEIASTDSRDLHYLLQSRAYTNFFQPLLLGIIQDFYRQLADPSAKRRWDKPDNYLRGGIKVAQLILNAPNSILAARARNEAKEEQIRRVDRHYDERAEGGLQPPERDSVDPFSPIGS